MATKVGSQSSSATKKTEIAVMCADGYALAATLWEGTASSSAIVIIHSATAVKRSRYAEFADYLVSRGFAVVTYDYRGVGGSRPILLRGFQASMRDWVDLDAEAVTLWARQHFPDLKLLAVGHSFGGHAIGLCESSRHLQAAVYIASHAGSLRFIRGRAERIRTAALFKVAGPWLCRFFGFMPAKFLRLGENLPRGVTHDWCAWVSLNRYFFDDPSMHAEMRFSRPKMPVLAIGIDDDPWATPPGIDLLVGHLTGCEVERRQVRPPQGGSPIGHMGFFRRQYRDLLWHDVGDWLEGASIRTGKLC